MRGKDATQKRFTPVLKTRSTSNNGPTRNGGGNGHGKATASDDGVMKDQPAISELLGRERIESGKRLERTALLSALTAFKKGDFSVRLPADLDGMDGKIADAFNEVMDRNERVSERPKCWGGVAGGVRRPACLDRVLAARQHAAGLISLLPGFGQ